MLAAQLAQASKVASSRSNSLLEESSGGIFWRAQVDLVAICTPTFTKYTPCPLFCDSFSVKLRKLTNFVRILVFFL